MTAPEPVLADVELRTGSLSRGAARAGVVAPLRSREPAEPLFSLLQGEEWMADARCRTLPPAVFFPVDLTGVVQAKRICAVCTVTTSCLEYALEHTTSSTGSGAAPASGRGESSDGCVGRRPPDPSASSRRGRHGLDAALRARVPCSGVPASSG